MSDVAHIPEPIAKTLVDPHCYASDEIFDAYAWLRQNMPFGRACVDGFHPFWVATKYADVKAISKDNSLFPYGDKPSFLIDRATETLNRKVNGTPNPIHSLVQMDPPEHMPFRLLSQGWFAPKNIAKRAEAIRDIALKSIARMEAHGTTCDFAQHVALAYPLEVIMSILGVPERDFGLMLRLTQESFTPQNREAIEALIQMDRATLKARTSGVVREFEMFFEALAEDRRKTPRDDLATVIAQAEIDGKPIGTHATNGYYIIIATAGHDTTSSSTAAAMWALTARRAWRRCVPTCR